MATNVITSTADIEPAVAVTYEKTLLQPPQPKYIHTKYLKKFSIAKKSGNTLKMRRYARLAAATTPLTEGITPSGSKLSKVDITAKISQYGDYITVTDVLDLTVEDPEITIALDNQNDQINNTVDQLARDYMCASATAVTCSNGSGTVTLLNQTDIDGVVQTLRGNDAEYITPMIGAGTGQGTGPVAAAFMAFADTDLEDDLKDVDEWLAVKNYAAQSGVDPAEVGSTDKVRWLTTTQGYVSSSVYSCPIIGKDAAGMIDLGGGNVQGIIKGFGSGGTADPIDQRATVGWKMWQAFRILQDLYIVVLKCTNG